MYSNYTFYCYLLQGFYAVLWCIVYVKKDLGGAVGGGGEMIVEPVYFQI